MEYSEVEGLDDQGLVSPTIGFPSRPKMKVSLTSGWGVGFG